MAILVRLLLYTTRIEAWIHFLPSQFQGCTVVGRLLHCSVASACFIVAHLSGTFCFPSKFPFLRDLSQLTYFRSNLYACLSIHRSVHCNSFVSTKYCHISCSAIWWDFSCIETCYYYHQAVRSSQMIGFTLILASCHMNLF